MNPKKTCWNNRSDRFQFSLLFVCKFFDLLSNNSCVAFCAYRVSAQRISSQSIGCQSVFSYGCSRFLSFVTARCERNSCESYEQEN